MKKMFLIPMLAMFGLALVFAGAYIVNSLILDVGVSEPFSVEYAMLGDAGNYNSLIDGTCASPTNPLVWFTSGDCSVTGNMFPGESRKLCIKITNEGEANIPYVITSKITEDQGNYANCSIAFPETSLIGDAVGSVVTTTGKEIIVPFNAPIVDNCEITIDVARGTQ